MGDAYGYALGIAPQPYELKLLYEIDRFGAPSVLGRMIYAGELYRMHVVENVYRWFQERLDAENFAAWGVANRDKANVLAIAEKNWIERQPE